MKYPNRDRDFRDYIIMTAKDTGIPIKDVEEAVEIYMKILKQAIVWDKPVTIHVDYIGDLVYNEKWRDKVKEVIDARSNQV